jgi:hypothetical protein
VRRAFPARRGPRPPRPTSGAPAPARHVLQVPLARGPARLRVPRASARPSGRVVKATGPTSSRVRELRPGQVHRAPRVLARPGRVRRGQAAPAPGLVVRVLAQGQAITRSARPRPAWGQLLRPGRKRLARLARLLPVVRVPLRVPRARPAVPAVRVRLDADPAVLVALVALVARVLAVRVRAALGQAR